MAASEHPMNRKRLISRATILLTSLTCVALVSSQDTLTAYTESIPESTAKLDMIPVAGGEMTIGGKKVKVKPFYIAKTETTWELYDAFTMSGDPTKPYDMTEFAPDAIARPSRSYILPDLGWGHKGYPVINASSTSVEMFCRWLSSVTKKKYRLPTAEEWEFAARAGVDGDWSMDEETLKANAWYAGNSRSMTHPVAKKAANKLGLFDMIGNVGEWCKDAEGKPVLCGGTFRDDAKASTPSERKYWTIKWQETDPQMPKSRWWLADGPFCGFRVVCEP